MGILQYVLGQAPIFCLQVVSNKTTDGLLHLILAGYGF